MPVRPDRPKRIVRVCWECLAESLVRESFNSHLCESFDHVPGEAGNIESEWPCSAPPLLRRPTGAVTARWSVPAVAVIPEPAGGHRQ